MSQQIATTGEIIGKMECMAIEKYDPDKKIISPIAKSDILTYKIDKSMEVDEKDTRVNSIGETFGDILKAQNKRSEDDVQNRTMYNEFVNSCDPVSTPIVIINFNLYVQNTNLFIPAELALTAFSVQEGIIDNYWSLIDPYRIPTGFTFETRKRSLKLGLPYPKFSNRFQDYSTIIQHIKEFLKKFEHPVTKKTMAFCLTSELKVFKSCLNWLFDQCEMKNDIQLHPLAPIVRRMSTIGINRRASTYGISVSLWMAKLMSHKQLYLISNHPTCMTKRDEYYENQEMCSSSVCSTSGSPITDSGYGGEEDLTSDEIEGASNDGNCGMEKVSTPLDRRGKSSEDPPFTRKDNADRGFYFDSEVDEYLESVGCCFHSELGCLFHMQENSEGIQYCALNIANHQAYAILNNMVDHYNVFSEPGYHHFAKNDLDWEKQRRIKMLSKRGIDEENSTQFQYDGKTPKMYNLSEIYGNRNYRIV